MLLHPWMKDTGGVVVSIPAVTPILNFPIFLNFYVVVLAALVIFAWGISFS